MSSLHQVYSEELETVAQTFADRCNFGHSNRTERNSLSQSFIQVGENVYLGAGLPVNLTDIIVWRLGFNESVDYNYDSNSCNPGRVCGHYTQVMNGDVDSTVMVMYVLCVLDVSNTCLKICNVYHPVL